MSAEYVIWAKPANSTDELDARPVAEIPATGNREADRSAVDSAIAARRADGWHSFRVQILDLSKPFNASAAFARCVRI
jgi:hypothetical protein